MIIPVTADDLTPSWLSDALQADVTAIEHETVGVGYGLLATILRLRLTYASNDRGLPDTMIAKLPSSAAGNRAQATLYGFYMREVSFYREMGARVAVRTPECLYADVNDEGDEFVLLLEEISDATSPDQVAGCSLDQARLVVDALASLHAPYWGSRELDDMTWLPRLNIPEYLAAQQAIEALWPAFLERWGDRVPAAALAATEALTPRWGEWLQWLAGNLPTTIAHYDVRADNLFFGGSVGHDGVCLIDWQLTARHVGTYDLAYFLAESVSIEDRRANELDLIRHYHSALRANGVDSYSLEQCEDDYRSSMLNLLGISTVAASLDTGDGRGDGLMEAIVTRSFTAAADLGSVELLARLDT